ncbi:tensin-1-like isoform X2 [Xenia sp. Carnegie-2017]|nr:tensin-1-like isoform X2 [Xenia sp. Carnegie-2017]XP_046860147.1 tensin-1-like isoform X2 [Xenia sp. Carnegie-2017]
MESNEAPEDESGLSTTSNYVYEQVEMPSKSNPKGFSKILKHKVSRGRSRHVDQEFDLDLTYITDRIIAMSFPATGLETTYRNNLKDVAKLLKKNHQENYLVFNLSGRSYDISKLNHQVLDFGWPDHLAPPLERLVSICKSIDSWLKSDPQHVVVVHCKGGKGRTGVVVASYMHYSKQSESPEAAMDEFAIRRFYDDKLAGVTQPSQRRYVHYLDAYMANKISITDKCISLQHIVVHVIPNYDGKGGCRPFFSIYQDFELIYETDVYTVNDKPTLRLSIKNGLDVRGDILVKCSHKSITSGREIVFRCQFHTDAVENYFLRFEKSQLDVAHKDKRFSENGAVEFIFSSSINSSSGTDDEIVMNEFYIPRQRIKSYQSTDSLEEWKNKDSNNSVETVQMGEAHEECKV